MNNYFIFPEIIIEKVKSFLQNTEWREETKPHRDIHMYSTCLQWEIDINLIKYALLRVV